MSVGRRCRPLFLLAVLLALLPQRGDAQTGTVMPAPKFTGLDNSGLKISGGKLCSFVAGTTTPQNTYTDVGLTTPNANPVVLDSAGRATVFLTPGASYKFILKTPGTDTTCNTGTTVWTQDNVLGVPAASANLDVNGTAGETITAGQVVYLSDGSASKTAGLWYRADATTTYSSATPEIGIAPSAIASTQPGTIRLSGSVTLPTAVVLGTDYYVATTAGAVTATAPANVRRLGRADSTSSIVLTGAPPPPPVVAGLCEGSLTLTRGLAHTTADVTAATTIFWTPYHGNRCAIYDGTKWIARTFTELSIAVPATTATIYDVFLFDNGGVNGLELNAWTNDTTPATAHSGATFYQDGVPIKAGTATRRYLGSFRTTAVSGQTEDSLAKRYLWNYYSRDPRALNRRETTASWNYTVATLRQANLAPANQVEVVVGVAESLLHLTVSALASNSSGPLQAAVAIGEDSTTVAHASLVGGPASITITASSPMVGTLDIYPAIGRHFYAWLEESTATGTTVWVSNALLTANSGLSGWIR